MWTAIDSPSNITLGVCLILTASLCLPLCLTHTHLWFLCVSLSCVTLPSSFCVLLRKSLAHDAWESKSINIISDAPVYQQAIAISHYQL